MRSCGSSLMVKPKNRPGPPGNIKIALVITAVDFDQFSLYSIGTGSVSYRPQTISATNHIGHDHIGHTKKPYRPKGITISATKKCTPTAI